MTTDPVAHIAASTPLRTLADALRDRRRVIASGVPSPAVGALGAACAERLGRPVVLVLAHLDDADEIADELAGGPVRAVRVPALEALPGESAAAAEQFADRLSAARSCETLSGPALILCPIQALMQSVPRPEVLPSLARSVGAGDAVPPGDLARWLSEAGYQRRETIEEPGDFAVRGGILDVFPVAGSAAPIRLDFFGDTIDRVSEIDLGTMASDRSVDRADLVAAAPERITPDDRGVSFLEYVTPSAVVLLAETMEIVEQGRGYYERATETRGLLGPPAVLAMLESRFHAIAELNQFSAGAAAADTRIDLAIGALPAFAKEVPEAFAELGALASLSPVLLCCQNAGEAERAGELLAQHLPGARVEVAQRYAHRGYAWPSPPLTVVPYHEVLNRFTVRRRSARMRSGRAMDTFLDIQPGDHVVHSEHGIARYEGLRLMQPRDLPRAMRADDRSIRTEPEEYLVLEFASKSRLYVPALQIDRVQKYVGGFHGKPPLSVLGGAKWRNQKERASESVRDLAAELMRVRAAREHLPGVAFPADTPWQREFEAEFPYEETQDQTASLAEIKKDMNRPRPMDRLLCGDVGFGKTELAIRAAFKAAEFGKQTAVLVPTTVLAEQHERTFRARFAGYPFRIESVSRYKSDAEVRAVLEELGAGRIDVIIGTHRLFSKDVVFADLGLVVIDEEQRFGVEHKESLLRLRMTADVLTLSATPIPRTLHMAMLGIRDISSLTTPPLDRRAIVTEVIPYHAVRVRQAIERELAREGQVFYVHNRVHDILSKADDIRRLVPDARIVVGHGQMPPHELENVMLRFIRREADILVATTIIESGIDIASANTMIIDDADRFGLADLHQLRGRVGRGKHRGYCYLLLSEDRTVREVAQKRLKAIEQYSMLGAGFKIAMRDLEIRGAGNILGAEQSGHIAAVGYEMFCRLLEAAVRQFQSDKPPAPPGSASVEIGAGGHIPKAYIPSDQRRLEAYRALATAGTQDAITKALNDLTDAYGAPPAPVRRLFDLASLRIALAELRVKTVTIREQDVVFVCENSKVVAEALSRHPRAAPNATIRPLPPKSGERLEEVYFRPPREAFEPDALLAVLRGRLGLAPPGPVTHADAPAHGGPRAATGRKARG